MKRHRTDLLSLLFGAGFLLVVLGWLLRGRYTVHLPVFGWMLAVGLIAAGVLGLLGVLRSGRDQPPAPVPVAAPAAAPATATAPVAEAGAQAGTPEGTGDGPQDD